MDRDRIWQLVDTQREFLVGTRRALHERPELSFKETATASFIEAALVDAGYRPRTGTGAGSTGVSAVLEGGLPGPTIALRADTDALPIDERNELSFRSRNPGVMHACGHDGHTAILLATARALKAVQPEIRGRVVFLFQHAEELPPGGAIELIEAGCLEAVDAAFGLHLAINLDVGRIVLAPGPRAASADTFNIEVRGRGGHGAFPHLTVDAVQVAAELVTSLHQIVSRRVNPLEPAVVTIGTRQAGTKENIIADVALLTGTVRAFSESARELLQREIERVARGVTSAWGATFENAVFAGLSCAQQRRDDERACGAGGRASSGGTGSRARAGADDGRRRLRPLPESRPRRLRLPRLG
jgi:amidohydrolase